MVSLLRVSPREAKARVDRAADMGPRRTPTGERLGPIFPAVARAERDGEISTAHASQTTKIV